MKEHPTHVFTIWFDGGYDGDGYGSWEVQFKGFSKRVTREQYGDWASGQTCNVAEYTALIKALEWLQSVQNKRIYMIEIWSDSLLLVNQCNGRYKTKKQHLKVLRDQVLKLLSGFGNWRINWHRRSHNVRRFGH